MLAFLAKLGKWVLKIPVLFAHFPGPALMLVAIAVLVGGSLASCVTHKLEAGARAELEIEVAQCQAGHAQAVAKAATEREGIIEGAVKRREEIDALNRAIYLEMARLLADRSQDDKALAALQKSIEDLHHDPKFECRLLPLPESHLERLRIEEARPRAAASETRDH